ncbi:hypothetical protein C8J43_10685 [Sphingomonas sp. PP-CE-1G-424]|nr:hypothetical protein C8J43_10685 [Sphingomonas sp. PP-CE-1G-424]
MTFTGANDASGPGGLCSIDMSVLDLAIFLRIHRSGRGTSAGEVAQTISHWFQCDIDPHEVEQAFPRMADKGWLVRRETGMRATIKGRKHGRSHLRGIVRMLDQGTRMLDVAAMMSVLKLAMIELDGEHDDDDDQD